MITRTESARRPTAVCAAGLLAVVLTGCGGDPGPAEADDHATTTSADSNDANAGADEDIDPDDAEPAEESSDTAPDDRAEPDDTTETAGGQTHEFPDIGLTIIEPDEVPPESVFALEMYVDFAHEWRWSLREVKVSDELQHLAAPDKLDNLQNSIEYQTENGIHYGGELIVELEYEDASENLVTFSACFDSTDYVWIDAEGENLLRGDTGNATAEGTIRVSKRTGTWLVREDINEDEPCPADN